MIFPNVIARSKATKQSDEVVARAKPVAISEDPSLRSGQGLLRFARNDTLLFPPIFFLALDIEIISSNIIHDNHR